MTETIQAGRSDQASPLLLRLLTTRAGRILSVVVCVAFILIIAMASYLVTQTIIDNDLKAANTKISQAQRENQQLTQSNAKLTETIADLKIQVKNAQAKLVEILPKENTYNIIPNQSLLVAGGRLTIGLIGAPTNESVNININGKSHVAAAGAVINNVLDGSTACQVGVQYFDMFRAVLTATCTTAKLQ